MTYIANYIGGLVIFYVCGTLANSYDCSDNLRIQLQDNTTVGEEFYTLNSSHTIAISNKKKQCTLYSIVNNTFILERNIMTDCTFSVDSCFIYCDDDFQNTREGIVERQFLNQKPPEVDPAFKFEIKESAGIGTVINDFQPDIKLIDCKDKGIPPVIQIMNNTDVFEIRNSLDLRLIGTLDYEKTKEYQLVLDIQHDDDHVYTTVTISVVDVDDMDPTFHNDPYFLDVPEQNESYVNVPLLTRPTINATDMDEGAGRQNLTYDIISVTGNEESTFSINDTDGVVSIIIHSKLDNEKNHEYDLVIRARQHNNKLRSATATVTVSVLDINNNLPHFINEPYIVDIDEHQSVGSYVIQIKAKDNDTNSEYSQTRYMLSNGTDVFSISHDTGIITVGNSIALDRENRSQITFQVKAIDVDRNETGDIALVYVTLKDKNDNSPEFSKEKYHFLIQRNGVNETVGKVNATDKDVEDNGKIKYSVSPDNGIGIYPDTGEVYLKETLHTDVEVVVMACDTPKQLTERRCDFAIANLYLTNQTNSFGGMKNFTVPENAKVGTIVGNLQTFNFHSLSVKLQRENNAFRISENGFIITLTALDRENITHYTFVVEIEGQVSINLTVNVEVTDVNDNAPIFVSKSYIFELPEQTTSSVVGSVNATDEDFDENANIAYSLQNNMDSTYFEMDNTSGEIRLSSKKIPDNIWILQLVAVARDNGFPRLHSVCNVYVSRVIIDGDRVKLSVPISKAELDKQKTQLESSISKIIGLTIASETIKANDIRSFMLLTATFTNGSKVSSQVLERTILEHLREIQALFSNPVNSKLSSNDSSNAPEIALIVVASLMFVITIVAIIVLSRKWKKKKTGERIAEILTRSSSMYESQEIKIKLDDETSDYNGSVNTQEMETNENDRVVVNDTAFENPTYQSNEEETLLKTAPTEAFNEAISSLDALSERLEEEVPNAPKPDYESTDFDDKASSDENRPASTLGAEGNSGSLRNNQYDSVDGSSFEPQGSGLMFYSQGQDGERDHENGERTYENVQSSRAALVKENAEEEPDVDYNIKQTRFSAQVFDIKNNVVEELKDKKKTIEEVPDNDSVDEKTDEADADVNKDFDDEELPDVDYNIKQARFSTQVIDIENDVVVELKQDKLDESKKHDDKENDTDYDDNTTFGDENDKVDEEINSPMDFLKLDDKDNSSSFNFGDEEMTAL